MDKFHLDRTAFKASSFEEADNHVAYWRTRPVSERLEAAFYLINKAYGTTNQTKLDRTVFSARKHER